MITVLMAACQGAGYIGEQLDSILAQTVAGIRILIADDHSTDGTDQIIKTYEAQYPERITCLYFDTPSGGAAANFGRLFRRVSEGYVMLSDQDDIWFPYKAERLLAQIKKMEGEFGFDTPLLVHSDMQIADEKGRPVSASFFKYQRVAPERNRLNQLLVENHVTGAAAMVNAAMLPYLQNIPADCSMHDWWMALVACCVGKIGWVEEPLHLYRQHGSNALGAKTRMNQYVSRAGSGEQVRENYRKMFHQAARLQKQLEPKLTPEQRQCLQAFLSLPRKNRIEKIRTIKKFRFYKNSWIDTMGMCLNI